MQERNWHRCSEADVPGARERKDDIDEVGGGGGGVPG
jgi:hypothetical protein